MFPPHIPPHTVLRPHARPTPTLLAAVAVALTAIVASLLLMTPAPSQATPRLAALGTTDESVPSGPFKVATFNILGSQHTLNSSRWKPGHLRARITARMIRERGIDIIGMQEVQADQLAMLQRKLDGAYGIWPGTELGNGGLRLQVAFNSSRFSIIDTGSIITVFYHQQRPIPWVLLRDRATGRSLYVVVIHNSPGGMEAERDAATNDEIRLIKQLKRTGRSVFVVGDANEKEEWFCKIVGRTPLEAANGGTAASQRDCQPPPGYLPVDWVMGRGPFTFSDYAYDEDPQVRRASDHRLVHTMVTMRPKSGRG